jgi:hypothetical protein
VDLPFQDIKKIVTERDGMLLILMKKLPMSILIFTCNYEGLPDTKVKDEQKLSNETTASHERAAEVRLERAVQEEEGSTLIRRNAKTSNTSH